MKIDIPDGRNQLHGAAIAVYDKKETSEVPQHVSFDRQSKPNKLTGLIYSIQYCPKPVRKNNSYPIYTNHLSSKVMIICRNDDIVWTLMKTLNNDHAENILTWSAYNYILTDKNSTNLHCILPVIQGTLIDWSNLYSAIAASAKLNVNIVQSSKTMISLDLQLCMKYIQLQSIGNVNQKIIFRIGELHTVFCRMKVLGKIIDASGLDMSLSIADIYGNTTVEQIKSGKHVYRSFEGYLTLYLSLYKIYLQKFIDTNPLIERDIRPGIINSNENLKNYKHHETVNYKMNHKETIDFLENINFHGLQDMFDKSLTNQAKCFRSFM